MERLIYHVDVNSAYLSWEATEQLKNGAEIDIRTIPSIIGGDTTKRKGIVLAKSVPAKKYGIKTGESVSDALKKCPFLKSFRPDFILYKKYSKAFIEILRKYAPVVEQVSVDEAYLDMSGLHYFYKTPVEAAEKIQEEIRETLGFTVNVGISSNKLLAKMASDFEKPDKIHTLFPEEIQKKMWPLPVRELFFTGASATEKLESLGIKTIGDLAKSDPVLLQAHFKSKGLVLWNYANGIDEAPVKDNPDQPKGYGNSMTLEKDVVEYEDAAKILMHLSETLARRLRKDHIYAQIIEVEIKDCHFRKTSHQKVLEYSTNTTDDLYKISCQLFKELWDGTPIRLLGIRCTKLMKEKLEQTDIFSGLSFWNQESREDKEGQKSNILKKRTKDQHKMEKLDQALDKIKEKYGEDAVGRAGVFFLEK